VSRQPSSLFTLRIQVWRASVGCIELIFYPTFEGFTCHVATTPPVSPIRDPNDAQVEETGRRNLMLLARVRDNQRQITQISRFPSASSTLLRQLLEGPETPGFTRQASNRPMWSHSRELDRSSVLPEGVCRLLLAIHSHPAGSRISHKPNPTRRLWGFVFLRRSFAARPLSLFGTDESKIGRDLASASRLAISDQAENRRDTRHMPPAASKPLRLVLA
jgi:hypothetical protein